MRENVNVLSRFVYLKMAMIFHGMNLTRYCFESLVIT